MSNVQIHFFARVVVREAGVCCSLRVSKRHKIPGKHSAGGYKIYSQMSSWKTYGKYPLLSRCFYGKVTKFKRFFGN